VANYSTPGITKQPIPSGDGITQLQASIAVPATTLPVFAFGKLDAHGVVRRGAIALAKKERGAGVRGARGDDFLEELGRDAAGAGKSRASSPPAAATSAHSG